MVFGRKKSLVPTRPVPPNIDQILEDLKSAGPEDPVFLLNPGLTEELLEDAPQTADKQGDVTEEDLADPNFLYHKVIEYVSAGGKVEELSQRIICGFDTLLASKRELEELTEQVKCQVEEAKRRRKTVGQLDQPNLPLHPNHPPERQVEEQHSQSPHPAAVLEEQVDTDPVSRQDSQELVESVQTSDSEEDLC